MQNLSEAENNSARASLKYPIQHYRTKTGGVVSHPEHNSYVFRLVNDDPERLMSSVEEIVGRLHIVSRGLRRSKRLRFERHVYLLSTKGQSHIVGTITSKGFFNALRERRAESIVGAFSIVVSTLLLTATFPAFRGIVVGGLRDPAVREWTLGIMDRIAGSLLVTTLLSWYQVLSHYFDVRRSPYVKWLNQAG
ncbi:hypothetical protein [Synechococcus sp. 1G10]|uniref:hypothetical protein n=1 Tax=Synechococcus sp. 1G10 TaxID=2025605 RepID=UPI00117DDD47|nr:hypothetical protein [Synechococcus sp. 1G10]